MVLSFAPLRLDLGSERLWQGEHEVPLRPKSFAVLRYLAERPGRLISGAELLRAVWPDVAVSDTIPRLCIREIRTTLGDDARQPRFLETRPRRGYRLVAAVHPTAEPAGAVAEPASTEAAPPLTALVGREAERDRLRAALRLARGGNRQLVFVTELAAHLERASNLSPPTGELPTDAGKDESGGVAAPRSSGEP